MNQLLKVKTQTSETIVTEDTIFYKPNVLSNEVQEIALTSILRVEKKDGARLIVSNGSSISEIYFGEYTNEAKKFLNNEITASEFKANTQKMKLILRTLLVVISVVSFWFFISMWFVDEPEKLHRSTSVESIVSQSQLSSVQSSLDGWAEGRWDHVQSGVTEEGRLLIRVYVGSIANQIAIDNYCDTLESVADTNGVSSGQRSLFVYQSGSIAKSCN